MMDVEIDTSEIDLIVAQTQATEKQIRLSYNRSMRRAMTPMVNKGRRILIRALQVENKEAVKPRFWASVVTRDGLTFGRVWLGFNPISIIYLKGEVVERVFPSRKRGFVRFRGKTYPNGFIFRRGDFELPMKREGKTLMPLKWEVDTEIIKQINDLIVTMVPERFIKEFERDLTARVKHGVGTR